MKPFSVDVLRAYLLMASLAASALALCVVAANFLFWVPEGIFLTSRFRICAAAVIVGSIWLTKWLASRAFLAALANHQVVFHGTELKRVVLSDTCARRPLVLLHLRFSRQYAELPAR